MNKSHGHQDGRVKEKSCLKPRALGLQYWKLDVECWKFEK